MLLAVLLTLIGISGVGITSGIIMNSSPELSKNENHNSNESVSSETRVNGGTSEEKNLELESICGEENIKEGELEES